jgi:hypothetical protein
LRTLAPLLILAGFLLVVTVLLLVGTSASRRRFDSRKGPPRPDEDGDRGKGP